MNAVALGLVGLLSGFISDEASAILAAGPESPLKLPLIIGVPGLMFGIAILICFAWQGKSLSVVKAAIFLFLAALICLSSIFLSMLLFAFGTGRFDSMGMAMGTILGPSVFAGGAWGAFWLIVALHRLHLLRLSGAQIFFLTSLGGVLGLIGVIQWHTGSNGGLFPISTLWQAGMTSAVGFLIQVNRKRELDPNEGIAR